VADREIELQRGVQGTGLADGAPSAALPGSYAAPDLSGPPADRRVEAYGEYGEYGELRAELDRLRLLQTLTLDVAATLDASELAARLLRAAVTALRADGGSLWLADDERLVCRLAHGPDGDELVGAEMPLESAMDSDGAGDGAGADDAPGDEAPADEQDANEAITIAAAMVVPDATIGALRVSRVPPATPFSAGERDLLRGLAAAGAVALRNAARVQAADRTRDLALLAELGREITATLDLDRVLRAVANLATRALAFDRGAVALYEHGQCDIRAVAGADETDPTDPKLQDLAVRAAWAAGQGESFYLSDRSAPASDEERIFLQIFGGDLEADGVSSGLYLPLRDEEGVVGILVFEAARPDFASERQRELAAILASQTTVAVRNAQLYSQVPLADVLGAFSAKKRAFLAVPRQRRLAYAAAAVAAVAAVTLVRWPLRVPAAYPVFRATSNAQVHALVPGVVERVLVREGMPVVRGDPVAQLRAAELRAERDALAAAAAAADREAALSAARGDAGDEQLQHARAASLRRELQVLDEQVGATVIRTPVSGTVLTARPEERVGASVDAGDVLVDVGRTDTLELEFGVDQRDLPRVGVGDEIRLRVDALPQRTFVGRVTAVGSLPADGASADDGVWFPVRALVPNDAGLLRPGMTAHARVLTAPASLAGRLLRTPLRTARLLWWRMWS